MHICMDPNIRFMYKSYRNLCTYVEILMGIMHACINLARFMHVCLNPSRTDVHIHELWIVLSTSCINNPDN